MNTVKIRQFGDPPRTQPIQTRDARIRDTVLNGGFRIDTNTRIEAEPANRIAPGDMGVLLDGREGAPPKPADVDALFNGFVSGLGMLTREEVAKMKTLMAKYARVESGRVNAVGITASVDTARRNADELQAINDNHKKFWNDQYAETERRIFGGR